MRTAVVADPRFAYWHGATFSNDGSKVIFTDEWGGGTAARCRVTDDLSWGADAIYDIVGGEFVFKSYVKMPAAQTTMENCVSHLPSLIPVPGRDIITQAWYQAGVSVIDFTDSANPKEIGYYDRGPISGTGLVLGGLWSSYYYNGRIFGSEIARGFDVWNLTPTARAVGERDRGRGRGAVRPPHAAAPDAVHDPAELRRRPLVPRPARAGGRGRREDARRRSTSSSIGPRTSPTPDRRGGVGEAPRAREPASRAGVRIAPGRARGAGGRIATCRGGARRSSPAATLPA